MVLNGSCLLQAFNMIDQNRDGFIDSEDLKDMLASLGKLIQKGGEESQVHTICAWLAPPLLH